MKKQRTLEYIQNTDARAKNRLQEAAAQRVDRRINQPELYEM